MDEFWKDINIKFWKDINTKAIQPGEFLFLWAAVCPPVPLKEEDTLWTQSRKPSLFSPHLPPQGLRSLVRICHEV